MNEGEEPLSIVASVEERADACVARAFPDSSRKAIAALFAEGAVRLGKRRLKKGDRVGAGATLELQRPPHGPEELRVQPEEGALQVLYEDELLLAVNKEAGRASHPLRPGERGTMANLAVAHCPELAGIGQDPREAGLVHRLDRHTTGVLVFAKTAEAWTQLRTQFTSKSIHKSYLALVHHRPVGRECSLPLAQRGKRVHADGSGLDAHTEWERIDGNEEHSLMRCTAHTGRMHQIRAHLAECESPIVGDRLYGSDREHPDGYFLHAESMSLTHPRSGEPLTITAPLPEQRQERLQDAGLSRLARTSIRPEARSSG